MPGLFHLSGLTALVTGAGQGMGLGVAQALAVQGARVALNDLYEDRAETAAQGLRERGLDVRAFGGDITDPNVRSSMVSGIQDWTGSIDILVNNAGVPIGMSTSLRTFDQLSQEDFNRQLDLNLHAITGFSHLVLPSMMERKFGRIIIISSESWRIGLRYGLSNYAAAKAAALGFMRHIAHEVGRDGITANAVSLGTMNNYGYEDKGSAVGRTGTPDDVGAVVAFLASREAAWMTGQTLALNGGAITV
ncbi:FabG Dehydrogenases with different specificities (related to short-chain alcohol dehydrogenases) [Burkholderiales bacterium]